MVLEGVGRLGNVESDNRFETLFRLDCEDPFAGIENGFCTGGDTGRGVGGLFDCAHGVVRCDTFVTVLDDDAPRDG